MIKKHPPESWLQECKRKGWYTATELRPYTGRPGAMTAYTLPSLVAGIQVPRAMPLCVATTIKVN